MEGGERLARYSFVGSSPYDVIKVGDNGGCTASGDPLRPLETAMTKHQLLQVPSVKLPAFDGGAVGYVAYDAVRHFEPRTAAAVNKQQDKLSVPEAIFMMVDELVVFDHVRHTIKVVAHVRIPVSEESSSGSGGEAYDAVALANAYDHALGRIEAMCQRLAAPLPPAVTAPVPTVLLSPPRNSYPGNSSSVGAGGAAAQGSSSASAAASAAAASDLDWEKSSNVGRSGYEGFVTSLKGNIVEGDIIQAVPSQRISKPLPRGVGAFDIYRQLRVVNPSPYMFYLEAGPDFQVRASSPSSATSVCNPTSYSFTDCEARATRIYIVSKPLFLLPFSPLRMQIVGASPEMLVKVDPEGRVYTHPIAGTRKRGATPEEDEALAAELLADAKERAEHIMLVDLGRNDVGRVSAPGSVRVDSLMHIERYSHVMHIVSNVSGQLAPGKTAYDAFRSVFPAGTVSGAPKVKAVELVASLEPQRRHVYAGAVGYVGYSGMMDTAIAIRTLVVRGGSVHLQAGAGIVYDSVPASEYEETVSKMRATLRAVDAAIAAAAAAR